MLYYFFVGLIALNLIGADRERVNKLAKFWIKRLLCDANWFGIQKRSVNGNKIPLKSCKLH